MIQIKHCKCTQIGARYLFLYTITLHNLCGISYTYVFSPTEIWSLDESDKAITMKLAEPSLYRYYSYPELFIVDSDFCTKK